MRNFLLVIHIVSSLLAFMLTLALVFRSYVALRKKLPLKKIDTTYPLWIVVLLYIQLILGFILFYYLINDYGANEERIASNGRYWMRFWAVEHFTLMIFTVVLAHIGYIYNKNSKTPQLIYKKNRLYYGITFILICLSLLMSVIR